MNRIEFIFFDHGIYQKKLIEILLRKFDLNKFDFREIYKSVIKDENKKYSTAINAIINKGEIIPDILINKINLFKLI